MNEYSEKIKEGKIIYSNWGYISYKFNDEIYFKIAKLVYNKFEDEQFEYIFYPFYDVLDALVFVEIPGIDLTMRREKYYRTNLTPVFVSERIPPKNRVNLQKELKESGLNYYNPFLLLLDSPKTYGGDKLYLKSSAFFNQKEAALNSNHDLYKIVPHILKKLAMRTNFYLGNIEINEKNRTILIKNYLYLYGCVSNYYGKKSVESIGRKRQEISKIVLKEIWKQYKNKIITIDEAVKKSGLGSKRTLYRRIKELDE